METIEFVFNGHVESSGNRTFLFVAAYVHALVGTAVNEAMDKPWVAVEGENNGLVSGKEGIIVNITKAVWVLGVGLKAHEVNNVDNANL